MLKINGKTFMNLQEAVQWLLANNALPFQANVNYVANTEIAKSAIINPSPAEIKVGALVLFADSKVGTVSGVTSNGFMVASEYTDIKDSLAYIVSIEIDASANLICTLSDGTVINAGLIREVSSFSIDASQHLIVNYNDGSTNDLGDIFSGDINIGGNLSVSNDATIGQDLTVARNASITKDLYVAETAEIVGKATLRDDLDVSGDADVGGSISGTSFNGDTVFEKVKDANGNARFVEGDLENINAGVTSAFAKWSLSGSHIMFVLAGTVANGATISDGDTLANVTLPYWIANEIYEVVGDVVEYKDFKAFASNYTTQQMNARLTKDGQVISIKKNGGETYTADRQFRIQFDLLIQ